MISGMGGLSRLMSTSGIRNRFRCLGRREDRSEKLAASAGQSAKGGNGVHWPVHPDDSRFSERHQPSLTRAAVV